MIQCQVVRDREEPRRKLGARPITLARLVNAKEYFLAKVFSLIPVADQVKQNAYQAILVPLHQSFKRSLHIRADLDHEPDIRITRLQLVFQVLGLCGHAGTLSPKSRRPSLKYLKK